MPDGPLETIQLRNEFYRDNYYRVLLILFIFLIANVILISALFFEIGHKPNPQYFAISNDGKIVELHSLNMAVLTPSNLLQWATATAIDTFSYNFVNYNEAMQNIQNRYTPDGWQNYTDALKRSRMLESVINKKLVVSAVPTATPTILDMGVVNGRYAWRVRLPILVTYQSSTEIMQQPVVVTMTIIRVSIVNNPDGIAVMSFVASEGELR